MERRPEPFSNPIIAPPYGPMPWYGRSYEAVTIEFKTDEEVMRSALPDIPGLDLGPKRTMCASIRPHYEPTHAKIQWCGSIWMQVAYHDMTASFRVMGFTSEDEPLIADREMLGYPLFLCERGAFMHQGPEVWGEIRRKGQMIFRVSLYIEELTDFDTALAREPNSLHYKKIPSADSVSPPLRQLVLLRGSKGKSYVESYTNAEEPFRSLESYTGRGLVEFGMTHFNLHKFQPKEVVGGYYIKVEGGLRSLGPATIIWEDEAFYRHYYEVRAKERAEPAVGIAGS